MLSLVLITHVIGTSFTIPEGAGRYYLIPMSILGFALVRSRGYAIFIFLYALTGFMVTTVLKDSYAPIIVLQKETSHLLYLFNFAVIFTGTFYLFFHMRLTNKNYEKSILAKNEQIQEQHLELSRSHKNIQDSITYAKRIQTAIMPAKRNMNEALGDHFVLYMPKDVVAGDFYWVEKLGDCTYFAVADCTGHGVPGAMVSVVCNSALSRAIWEYNLKEPAKILDKVRYLVMAEFGKSEETVHDGMDIALCCVQGNKLKFSGAFNPAWIIRKADGRLEEVEADRQPVGPYTHMNAFTNKEVELHEGDAIYIFSDGYADQFGGERTKKYSVLRFKKLILEIHDLPMEAQMQRLRDEHDHWRGGESQIDDICVMGVRVTSQLIS